MASLSRQPDWELLFCESHKFTVAKFGEQRRFQGMRGTGWTEEERILEATQMLLLSMQERNSMVSFSDKDFALAQGVIGLFLSPTDKYGRRSWCFSKGPKGLKDRLAMAGIDPETQKLTDLAKFRARLKYLNDERCERITKRKLRREQREYSDEYQQPANYGGNPEKPDMLSPFRKRIAAEVECEAGDWSSNDGSYTDSFTKTLMLVHHLTGSAPKWRFARHHLPERDSERILVNAPLITGGSGQVSYEVALPSPDTINLIQGSQALRVYAQPGTNLFVKLSLSFPATMNETIAFVSLSGYFVNVQ
jgi:hypothetical protein